VAVTNAVRFKHVLRDNGASVSSLAGPGASLLVDVIRGFRSPRSF
jgi:hypothetical protein